ncbi:MAG TPA: hypothetical protein VIF62_03655 [Labilithrix sp.]
MAGPQPVIAEGGNYRVVVEGSTVRMVVWRAPDLPSAAAAADFERAAERVRGMVATLSALLLDAREAPKVAGPRTTAALTALLGAFAARKKRVAIVCSDDALQQLQFKRLVGETGAQYATIFGDLADAEQWLVAK